MSKKFSYSGEFSFLGHKPEPLAADIGTSAKAKPAAKPTHILRKHGKESLHNDFASAHKAAMAEPYDPGVTVSDMSGKILKRGERYESAIAAELAEAWWCGTPEVMEKERKKLPPNTTNQPDKVGNWSVNAVDKPVTEASDKVKKASKPKQPKADKPNRVPTAKNEDPAMAHAKKIMKMANCVSSSVHASPLGILAAEYAKHTFHPSNIGEEKIDEVHPDHPVQNPERRKEFASHLKNMKAGGSRQKIVYHREHPGGSYTVFDTKAYDKPVGSDFMATLPQDRKDYKKRVGEAAETIVNKFLEDTMTGDVASMALGFAPTGEMDPHEGRPGKKKKKKSQFKELSSEMSGGSYGKLARKVSGNMSGV